MKQFQPMKLVHLDFPEKLYLIGHIAKGYLQILESCLMR